MAQNENYSQVDLRVGTEEQFNAKVGTLPAGTLFGTTDSTVSKADLSTDLKNEINGKINKPANPTSDSAVVINSFGEISTKPLNDISGKTEVAVGSTTPLNDEILWINPNGTSGGGSSSGGKLYSHLVQVTFNFDGKASVYMKIPLYAPTNSPINTIEKLIKYFPNHYEPGRYAFLDGHNGKYAVFLLGINTRTTQPFTTYCKTGDDITFDGYSSYSITSTHITEL